jgi:hypothetical protein
MSRNMQARQAPVLVPRAWPSMAAASAGISRSSRTPLGRAGAGTAVLSLITPEPVEAREHEVGAKAFVANARLEGQLVVTLTQPGSTAEPITLRIPLEVTIAEAERLVSAGSVEE